MVGRSTDLEEFLKRVEDYDLQRKGSADVAANGNVKDVHGGYSQESLERARKLLSENSVAIIDQGPKSASTLDAPQLAYRSAYNYERTFSPKRVTEGSKTYTVSEEDYLLLQKLKAKEKSPPSFPSRDKYKNNDRLRILLDDTSSNQMAGNSLPKSDYYNVNLGSIKTEVPPIETAKYRQPPPTPPKSRSRVSRDVSEELDLEKDVQKPEPLSGSPISPARKIELKTSPKRFDLKAELEPPKKTLALNNDNKDIEPSLLTRESPSELSMPSSHLDFLDSVQKNKMDITEGKPKLISQSKPLSSHPDRFIDSTAHKSTPPAKPVKPLVLANTPKNLLQRTESGSYISSALKSSSPQSNTSSATQTNFKIPSKPSTESFINSALKTSPPPPATKRTTTTVKPPPVTKPASLKKSLSGSENSKDKPEKPTKPPGLTQLRPTSSNEKPKPQVPPKKSEIVLPKLRHVDLVDSSSNGSKSEPDFTGKLKKNAPPEVPKKKPSLPEALTRLSNLSKPQPSPEHHEDVPEALTKLGRLSRAEPPPKREEGLPEALTKIGHLSRAAPPPKRPEDLPEALTHLEKLNRVSKQPPVPARKISMAEALQKAQELKKQQQQQQQQQQQELTQSSDKQPKDVRSELGAVLMAQQLKAPKPFIPTSSNTESSSNNSSTVSLVRETSTPTTPKTDVYGDNTPKTLNHANKTRAKGPKRRVPSSLKK